MSALQVLSIAANLVTAFSYFWIPIQSFLYLNQARVNLDAINTTLSEWVRLAVLFVFACGVHHFVMGVHGFFAPHGLAPIQIFVDLTMAFVSAQAAIRIRGFLKLIVPNPN